MKKMALLFAILCAGALNGMETATFSPQGMSKNEIHRELLGKVKKLAGYDDIYVGAGYSDAREPMFFAMEKLDDQQAQIWQNYAQALYQSGGIISKLNGLRFNCQDQESRKELKEENDFYSIELMDLMCPNKLKFAYLLGDGGTRAGINGFNNMLSRQRSGGVIYVAYASTQPITGPFKPKKEINSFPTLQEFEAAYPDIIISIGVDMEGIKDSRTEHRGIFKNPFFDIRGKYRNIAMKLHGWAGIVEKLIFHKTYMTVWPTPQAAELLHKTVKPGDMYIGVTTNPYPYNEELKKKFPSIEKELIGIDPSPYSTEKLHVFELNVLSKYYTE